MNKFILILFLSSLSFVSYGQQTVGLFANDSAAFNGYTFFSPGSSTHSYLVDNCGELINQWTASNQPGLAAYLLPNGNILRTARIAGSFNGGGIGGRVEMYDWNSTLIWSYDHANAQYHQHHDVEYLPNGNILILAWESRSTTEAINSGRDPNAVNNNGVWPTRITEVQPVGLNGANVVWEWHLWDHLVQDFDNTKANYGAVSDHPELLDINAGGNSPDWIHANSIDYNPVLDQIMISSKSMSEIFVIDHSTTTAEAASHTGGTYGKGGDFLYRWGNPQNYGRGTTADRKLYGQHDA
ncbi:MAG: hypothetical protein HKO56_07835, partial [Bacteroidia bacterium]|nr:hypothetical protein [Bacteroidia bacterium]